MILFCLNLTIIWNFLYFNALLNVGKAVESSGFDSLLPQAFDARVRPWKQSSFNRTKPSFSPVAKIRHLYSSPSKTGSPGSGVISHHFVDCARIFVLENGVSTIEHSEHSHCYRLFRVWRVAVTRCSINSAGGDLDKSSQAPRQSACAGSPAEVLSIL